MLWLLDGVSGSVLDLFASLVILLLAQHQCERFGLVLYYFVLLYLLVVSYRPALF